ncbi:energy transducer TonB [Cryomorphaceae bacterium 1068]|nr:energy transducer TonB [Cryomorphaceae bacterium 1068]
MQISTEKYGNDLMQHCPSPRQDKQEYIALQRSAIELRYMMKLPELKSRQTAVPLKALITLVYLFFGVAIVYSQDEPTTYTIVESMPYFNGGREAMSKYLSDNIRYTESAEKANVSGTIYVTFVVDEDGRTTETKILRSLHPDLDSIAIAMIERMPDWNPGMQRGKKVRVQYNLPIVLV